METMVLVYADLRGAPAFVGRLWARQRRDRVRSTTAPSSSIRIVSRSSRLCIWDQAISTLPRTNRYSVPLVIPRLTGGAAFSCAALDPGAPTGKSPRPAPCARSTISCASLTRRVTVRCASRKTKACFSRLPGTFRHHISSNFRASWRLANASTRIRIPKKTFGGCLRPVPPSAGPSQGHGAGQGRP